MKFIERRIKYPYLEKKSTAYRREIERAAIPSRMFLLLLTEKKRIRKKGTPDIAFSFFILSVMYI